MAALRSILDGHAVRLCLGVRNPATFLPAVFARQQAKSEAAYFADSDLRVLRWSDVIARMCAISPDLHLTVWCDEDSPLLWPEILRAVVGLPAETALDGDDIMAGELLFRADAAALTKALQTSPPLSRPAWRAVVAQFLTRHADPARLDMAIHLSGWTENLIEDLTRIYDHDMLSLNASAQITLLHA